MGSVKWERESEKLLLCLIRALHEYYRRVRQKDLVGRKKETFDSTHKCRTYVIASPTITSWLKILTLDAYRKEYIFV